MAVVLCGIDSVADVFGSKYFTHNLCGRRTINWYRPPFIALRLRLGRVPNSDGVFGTSPREEGPIRELYHSDQLVGDSPVDFGVGCELSGYGFGRNSW